MAKIKPRIKLGVACLLVGILGFSIGLGSHERQRRAKQELLEKLIYARDNPHTLNYLVAHQGDQQGHRLYHELRSHYQTAILYLQGDKQGAQANALRNLSCRNETLELFLYDELLPGEKPK